MPDYLKQLWTVKTRAGIADEDFRTLAESVTGKESTRAMTDPQRKALVAAIQKMFPETKTKTWKRTPNKYDSIKRRPSNIFALRTPDQTKLCNDLITAINQSTDYKSLTIGHMAWKMFQLPPEKISRHQEISLTEALKSILQRSHKDLYLDLKQSKTPHEATMLLLEGILRGSIAS